VGVRLVGEKAASGEVAAASAADGAAVGLHRTAAVNVSFLFRVQNKKGIQAKIPRCPSAFAGFAERRGALPWSLVLIKEDFGEDLLVRPMFIFCQALSDPYNLVRGAIQCYAEDTQSLEGRTAAACFDFADIVLSDFTIQKFAEFVGEFLLGNVSSNTYDVQRTTDETCQFQPRIDAVPRMQFM
jgi:hypothetical protein